ncbi:hypothetical protein C1T30_43050, partial [Bacillus sp. MBGLi97]
RVKKENVNPNKKNLLERSLTNKKFPFEKPKKSEIHLETIEILLNLLLPFMSSNDYSSSEENKNIIEEQVTKYLETIIKLNTSLFNNNT